jgi:hypothetical protein
MQRLQMFWSYASPGASATAPSCGVKVTSHLSDQIGAAFLTVSLSLLHCYFLCLNCICREADYDDEEDDYGHYGEEEDVGQQGLQPTKEDPGLFIVTCRWVAAAERRQLHAVLPLSERMLAQSDVTYLCMEGQSAGAQLVVNLFALLPCSAIIMALLDYTLQFELLPPHWPLPFSLKTVARRQPLWLPVGTVVTCCLPCPPHQAGLFA